MNERAPSAAGEHRGASSQPDVIEAVGITKQFPGVKSLDAVSFGVRGGEIHALVGENGAGKSTLMKVLAGAYTPDDGELRFDGQPVQWKSPADAKARGIHIIYQELVLFPQSSVAQNILAGIEPRTRLGSIDHRAMNERAAALLRELGVQLDPRERVGALSVANQQMVEIAKAMASEIRVLILDEPTAVIAGKEVQLLFQRLRVLRERGVAIIYISHRLDEIFELCDRVTVMKDGCKIGTQPVADTSHDALVRMMVGREMKDIYPPKAHQDSNGTVLMKVAGLHVGSRVVDASLSVRAGEIVGLAGMVGSGRTELASGIFGALPARGSIEVRGTHHTRMTPATAIRLGLGFVTEDRKSEGLLMYLNVAQNVTAATLRRVSRFGLLRANHERAAGAHAIREYSVAGARPTGSVATLSGGNQQKVLISRWVRVCTSVLILDEPTRGVDIGAKAEIYRLMRQLTERGLGILMISSELQEVIGMSDRVLVMREGRIAGELSGERMTEQQIMALATGSRSTPTGGAHASAH
ncbi:sugar ABC transporter ATP-binding protein [Paraburkholderia rhizosphaerae]|uniref:Monosaccharide ABC transporter ATP-binding protein (CUT2 family) n=1 Tax=Paraburkholderia rhizosphaerae TaxID=480658 RepID=A0A4R8LLS6_9BURK|nr:sugar ABC transporter ATP-binding protein [Paraburkholderia rhizosphaerae]TDY43818.1 monosaccharide ABC transporter ATP-binding protein (CUT2 family) [Paraburkholderia rhizosphaerae]